LGVVRGPPPPHTPKSVTLPRKIPKTRKSSEVIDAETGRLTLPVSLSWRINF
jgi:hypothetical protein